MKSLVKDCLVSIGIIIAVLAVGITLVRMVVFMMQTAWQSDKAVFIAGVVAIMWLCLAFYFMLRKPNEDENP